MLAGDARGCSTLLLHRGGLVVPVLSPARVGPGPVLGRPTYPWWTPLGWSHAPEPRGDASRDGACMDPGGPPDQAA